MAETKVDDELQLACDAYLADMIRVRNSSLKYYNMILTDNKINQKCICGHKISKSSIKKHLLSTKHLNFIMKPDSNNSVNSWLASNCTVMSTVDYNNLLTTHQKSKYRFKALEAWNDFKEWNTNNGTILRKHQFSRDMKKLFVVYRSSGVRYYKRVYKKV